MKQVLCTLVWWSVSLSSLAQSQSEKPHFIRVLAGASIPIGVYSQSESKVRGGDYASLGWSSGGEAAFFFHRYIGIGGSVLWSFHGINDKAMEAYCEPLYGYYDFVFTPHRYQMQTLLAGVYGRIPFKKRFLLDISLKAGQLTGKTPEIVYYQLGVARGLGAKADNKQSFAYQLGLGGTMRFAKHWQISLQTTLTSGKPKFEYISPVPSMQAQNYQVTYINAMLGLEYTF
jgi:hypothetical protein